MPVARAGEEPGDTVFSWSRLRRHTAEEALASLAHAFCAVEVDFQRVERVRIAQRAREGDIGYLPFVARAVIEALTEYPQLNAAVADDQLVVRKSVHLGVALGLDHYEGRVIPVIREADELLLRGIAREIGELERRARAGELATADVDGGTFTITKPGVGDTLVAIPIIQRPQVAVLATDGARRRPVMVHTPDGSEGITVHTVGTIGLSFDQRAVDATYASAFLDEVRTVLETRDWAAEL
jgi:2-oxoglutarate dehydrogenase E2 component (dihydrolipoamide succinyltransferase)